MSTLPPPGEGADRDDGVDVDAAWAQILAHWDDAAGGPTDNPAGGADAVRPARHRLEPPGPPGEEQRRRRTDSAASDSRASAPERAPDRAPDRGLPAPPDPLAEEHWTPPEPPPLPRGGWRSWLPWVGVLGLPFFFVVVVVTKPSLPPPVMLVAVLGFVAGFVTLVMRLPNHRDDDDDGARV